MRYKRLTLISLSITFAVTSSYTECTGSNGRGWGQGKGNGQFEMAAADGHCMISFPGFINDTTNTRIPATELALTKAPSSGTIGKSASGIVYTPQPGFRGTDTFCTRNTSPEVRGTLSGCVSVTVR